MALAARRAELRVDMANRRTRDWEQDTEWKRESRSDFVYVIVVFVPLCPLATLATKIIIT